MPSIILKLDKLILSYKILDKAPIRSGFLQKLIDSVLTHGMHRSDAQQILLGISGGGESVSLIAQQEFNPIDLFPEELIGTVDPIPLVVGAPIPLQGDAWGWRHRPPQAGSRQGSGQSRQVSPHHR
jgi:hypothetical protein